MRVEMIVASALGVGGAAAVILFLFLAGLYLLPTLVGWARGVHDLGMVAVLNILLGWTLIGWAVALALAFRTPRPRSATNVPHGDD